MTTPDNSVTLPTYNEANLLEQMAVRLRGADQATLFVANIDYNARGQRERISYATTDGTNFTTTYDYDPNTFRLTRLHTVRHRDDSDLQDLNYAYDSVGSITSIRDNAQQTVFFSNTQVEPHNDYTYDALYRLIRAEGREHAAQNNLQRDATEFNPIIGIPFPNSPEALQRYVEEYAYDSVGNILSWGHVGGAVQRWTRRYQYAEDSNRLLATSLPGDGANEFSALCSYDAHGNITTMPHLPLMQWNFKDELQATSSQVVNEGVPEITYYVYDAGGQRVRKVTESQAGEGQTPIRCNERIYLGGFEVYREFNGDGSTVTLERETLHVMDDQQRIAQIDTRTQGNDDAPIQSRRFQLSNHLGSAMLEVDDQANVISYEEYHPYGTSAYRVGRSIAEVSLKQYRYTGKEKDAETGLYYHGARYYACWLGRWTAADPLGVEDGVNRYRYAAANPTKYTDSTGTIAAPPDDDVVGNSHGSSPGPKDSKTIQKNLRRNRGKTFLREAGVALGLFDPDNLNTGPSNPTDSPARETAIGTRPETDETRKAREASKEAAKDKVGSSPPKPKKKPAMRFDPPRPKPGTITNNPPGVSAPLGNTPVPDKGVPPVPTVKHKTVPNPRSGGFRSKIGGSGLGKRIIGSLVAVVVGMAVLIDTGDVKAAGMATLETVSPLGPTEEQFTMEIDNRPFPTVTFGSVQDIDDNSVTTTEVGTGLIDPKAFERPGLIGGLKSTQTESKIDQRIIQRTLDMHRERWVNTDTNSPTPHSLDRGRSQVLP